MKKRIKLQIIILSLFFLFLGCQEKNFEYQEQKCANTKFINILGIHLTGFTPDSINTILVKVYNNGKEVDRFYINPTQATYKPIIKYRATINRKININNILHFYIKGEEKPFILSNMKMKIEPCVSMLEKKYCCDMRQFDLDGKTYYEGTPNLQKRE